MSMTKNRRYLVAMAVLALSSGAGAASAVDVTCPAKETIKQSGVTQEGTDYAAAAGGYTWKGTVSTYGDDLGDLNKLGFVGASIVNAKHFVACDYHGENSSSLRLTIDTKKAFVPVNTPAWTGSDSSDCKATDVAKCEFKQS